MRKSGELVSRAQRQLGWVPLTCQPSMNASMAIFQLALQPTAFHQSRASRRHAMDPRMDGKRVQRLEQAAARCDPC